MKYIAVILSLVLLAACGDQGKIRPGEGPAIDIARLPVQESWNSKIVFSEKGKLQAILFTDNLKVYSDEEKVKVLEGVKIEFYNEQEQVNSTLTSKRGRVDDVTRDMYAIDSVVAVSDSGVTLTTDELIWRSSEEKIVTDKFVTIISRDEKIEGYGFESDQDLTNYVIFNPTYYAKLKNEKK